MISFYVKDMTCGHCASSVTKAVQAVEPAAQVQIDLAQHRVDIQGQSNAEQLRGAIAAAGYTPEPVAAA